MNTQKKVSIGVDLGGTKISAGVFTDQGELLERHYELIGNRVGPEVGQGLLNLVMNLMGNLSSSECKVTGVGVGVPGIYKSGEGTVWAPNIPGWENYPLRDELISVLDGGVEIYIDNDRACSILGETWMGAARGEKNAVFLAVGTGIGAGILTDGHLLRGQQDIAGSVGWMALSDQYLEGYKYCGCFEYHASGTGMHQRLSEGRKYVPVDISKEAGQVISEDIFEAFDSGDGEARKILRKAIGFWGKAAANIVSLFNPAKVIFGGGIFGPGVRFIPDIETEARKWAQPIAMKGVTFLPSALGADACLYGAGFIGHTRA